MNQTSRTDDNFGHPDWNQNPPALSAETTTREDLNGKANSREHRVGDIGESGSGNDLGLNLVVSDAARNLETAQEPSKRSNWLGRTASAADQPNDRSNAITIRFVTPKFLRPLIKFASFIGPGFMIAVAYIDPGNYSTDVSAGAQSRYALLFVVLMANLFAVFLQSLCIKLGTVTGRNLAEMCRLHLPRWLNIILYLFIETAIIATDMAEVIGTAIALNLLLKIPLIAGCALTMADVLLLLLFYRPGGSMTGLRIFELFVMALVFGVTICFCIQLSLIKGPSVGEVFRGYLPSSAVVKNGGIYQSCGIIGATVMPHSLFLGSATVQPRLKEYDVKRGLVEPSTVQGEDGEGVSIYRPSIQAIQNCLKYSVWELILALFTFALFVNSAILIVAGTSLSNTGGAENADLFGIYDLLKTSIAPIAGTVFGLALLLSGLSAGIICTIAGQIVSEGMIQWTLRPWIRRMLTRSISIVPSIIVAAAVGRNGLNAALNASQVVLSVILPFVAAPLVYFTSRNRFMTVTVSDLDVVGEAECLKMRNGWLVAGFAVATWLVITVMNVALLVLVGLGEA